MVCQSLNCCALDMHSCGINLRFLGRMLALSRHPEFRKRYLMEMCARALRKQINRALRGAVSREMFVCLSQLSPLFNMRVDAPVPWRVCGRVLASASASVSVSFCTCIFDLAMEHEDLHLSLKQVSLTPRMVRRVFSTEMHAQGFLRFFNEFVSCMTVWNLFFNKIVEHSGCVRRHPWKCPMFFRLLGQPCYDCTGTDVHNFSACVYCLPNLCSLARCRTRLRNVLSFAP